MSAQLIHAYFDAFNGRNEGALLDMLSDEIIHDINQGAREVGRDRFQDFLGHMNECYQEQIVDLVVMSDVTGLRFAAEYTVIGTYLKTDAGFPEASGQTYRLPAGSFFEVELGKIMRVSTYYNVREWLLQIGSTAT
ncbi:MAG: ketosteroid isomerase-related protein [Myxococcales bacterium]